VEITLKRKAEHAVVTAENGISLKIFPFKEQQDPALLAQRLMDAEARAASLVAENEELKSILEMQNEKLRENRDAMAAAGANRREEQATDPGWREKTKAEVLAVVERWRKAQEEKDINAYSALYSPMFKAGQIDRANWLEQAKARFAEGEVTKVTVFNRYVKIGQGSAMVDLSAQFITHDGAKKTQKKTITLGPTPQGWKIELETGGEP
ncbi:MAG: nuclear transport factor 2 family protein, partial [Nitrospinota bacterium]|nr:nuclear transport factor 2 family protein [Nitrospinota bacterium]